MKRYISLLLILPLIIGVVAAPVSAAEANYGVINLLEYAQIAEVVLYDGQGQLREPLVNANKIVIPFSSTSGSIEIGFYLPGFTGFTGWSSLVSIDGIADLTDEDGLMTISSTSYSPNVLFLSFSDSTVHSAQGDYLWFAFDFLKVDSGESSIEFLNFYIKTAYDSTVRTSIEIYDVLNGTSATSPSSGVSYDYLVNMNDRDTNNVGTPAGSCCIRLRPTALEGTFDFWDLNFEVTGINVTSISCLQGDKGLKFDVSYSYLDADGVLISNPDLSDDTLLSTTYTRYWVSLRVYTEGSNFIQGWPVVFINGTGSSGLPTGKTWSIKFYPSFVSYNVSILDPYVFWLSKLYMVLHPDGGESAADAFQSQVDQQSQQLQEMAGVMDSVDKPAMDSVQSDINAFVPQGDIMLATAPLGTLLGNEIVVTIFSISLVFVLASYVLYGKKG